MIEHEMSVNLSRQPLFVSVPKRFHEVTWQYSAYTVLSVEFLLNIVVLCWCLTELEAIEACEWLREAGFPQYAQLYRSTYSVLCRII